MLIFSRIWTYDQLCNDPGNFSFKFFHNIQKIYQENNIWKNCLLDSNGWRVANKNMKCGVARFGILRYFANGWIDHKYQGMLSHKNKKRQNFLLRNFLKFDVSEKKSADFSCLFTFFLKKCKFKNIFTTIREMHNRLKKIVICLHFCITT